MNRNIMINLVCLLVLTSAGCSHMKGNVGHMSRYSFADPEPDWIRNGEPFECEGVLWHPQDSFDMLLDQEVILIGEYQGIEYFVDKIDVKPYNRLYTKFGRNKFRIYLKER